jgi:uncharacterized membrane protein YcaP (DUF421 family)/sugar lactone lactonase YvrE
LRSDGGSLYRSPGALVSEHPLFFESWSGLGRVALIGTVSYLILITLLRFTGKKTITKMNIFDFVFVVALGDVFANGITENQIPYVESLGAILTLVLLRILLQTLAKKSERFESILNGSPLLLFRDGEFLEDAMQSEDVTREEILNAVRQMHKHSLDDVEAVVIETDGTFSVIEKADHPVPASASTLADVLGARERRTPEGKRIRTEKSGGTKRRGSAAALFVAVCSAPLLGLGCGRQSSQLVTDKSPAYPRDSVETRSHLIGMVEGFYQPESARYDGEQDVWFVSNVAGEGSGKDGNGYIVKVDAGDLTKSSLFAVSRKNGVYLDAPKGMAIQGDTLWVADIDVLRGFDRHTGKPVANIDFKPLHAVLLNDVGAGPDGSVYISDTGIHMTDKGVVRVGGDKVFRLAPDRSIQVVLSGDTLGRPNGVSWDPKTKQWMMVTFSPWDSGLFALGEGGRRTEVARGTGEWDGLEMLADGRALVTSWRDSSVHLISGRSDERLIRGVSTPADLGIDTRRGVIAVPQIMSGRVGFWTLAKD